MMVAQLPSIFPFLWIVPWSILSAVVEPIFLHSARYINWERATHGHVGGWIGWHYYLRFSHFGHSVLLPP